MGFFDSLGGLIGQATQAVPAALEVINAIQGGGRTQPPIVAFSNAPAAGNPFSLPALPMGNVQQVATAGMLPDAFAGFPGTQQVPDFIPSEMIVRGTRSGGVRALSQVHAVHPITGRLMTYKNMGRCVLFSGDLSAAKRVRKVAARARRAKGR